MSLNDEKILDDRKIVDTKLSIHPDIEVTVSKFQKEFLGEEILELPPIKEGDINIIAAYIFDMGDKYESAIYIRNGLNKDVNFENIVLHLADKEGNIVGSQEFDLREVGKIPSMSARPWKIYFDKQNVKVDNINKENYKIVFDTKLIAKPTVDLKLENIPEGISMEIKKEYEEFLNNLPRIQGGEFSLTVYNLEKNSEGDINITVMFRNGSSQAIKMEKIPIKVIDKEENIIIKGIFELEEEDIKISPLSARLHRFVFPEEIIENKEFELSECNVIFD